MEAEVTIATDSGRSIEGIVPAQHRWLFTRRGEEGQPLLALHPDRNNDDYRRVTFLAEATRQADLIVVDQLSLASLLRSNRSSLEVPLNPARATSRRGS
jgi:hypothetical protein